MFEQIVRPFAARPIVTTSRRIARVTEATAETAILSWGTAGTVSAGSRQEDGLDLEQVGFNLNQCNEDWRQNGAPETEQVEVPVLAQSGTEIGTTTIDRIKKIRFARPATQQQQFSYVAAGVSEVIAGLRRDIPGSGTCNHSYTFNW